MLKSNLIEILSVLTPKEIKELGDFVSSPYFNKNEGVVKLFGYLKKYHPAFSGKDVEKEKVFSKIFHGAQYNDVFMRSLIFRLSSLAEDYITINDFRKETVSYNIRQADSLLERSLDGHSKKLIKSTISRLEGTKKRNSDFFLNRYRLETLNHIIYSRIYKPLTVKDKPDIEMMIESDNLLKFFFIRILQRYRYLLNKSLTVNTNFELDFLDEIMVYLKNEGSKLLEIPLLKILYRQVMLLINPAEEKLYYELRNILTDDSVQIDIDERRDGLTVLSNYCIDRFYSGKEEYRTEMHMLNRYVVERNLFNRVKGGYFEPAMFNNTVTIALSLGENEWVLRFIEKYHTKLSPDIRNNTYNFCYSKYYFNIKDFKKSLEYINRVTYNDIYHKFHGRIVLITLHYELGNYDAFFNVTESSKKFITNDKLLTEQHKTTNSNFIKFAVSLCRIKSGSSSEDPGLVKKNIAECEAITYRKWLLNKADELIRLRK